MRTSRRATAAGMATVCSLRVVTFNVLAPCYRVCKPLSEIPWRTRQQNCCDAIGRMDADVDMNMEVQLEADVNVEVDVDV